MEWVEVASQADLEKAVKAGNGAIVHKGLFYAYDSSQVRAYGSSQVRAYDSSQVRAYGSSAVTRHGDRAKIIGGVLIQITPPKTAEEWADFHGVDITGSTNRTVVVFKALNDDYTSPHGLKYEPGSKPTAPDWDGGKRECGGGLHFSPTPHHALAFHPDATRFVACPVLLDDVRPPQSDDAYPEKIKARRVFRPVYEVDINGNRI